MDQEYVKHTSDLAAERPLRQRIHDEEDRDEGEEDAVDVYFWELGRRLVTFRSFSSPRATIFICWGSVAPGGLGHDQ